MSEDEYAQKPSVPNFKVLLIGSTGVGKTSLTLRFAEDKFQDNFSSNLSVDFKNKEIAIKDKQQVKLTVWDVAGDKVGFQKMVESRTQSSDAIVILYDITNSESLNEVTDEKGWVRLLKDAPKDIVKYIVGCKSDSQKRAISTEKAKEAADKAGFQFMETSAKTGSNVQQLFVDIGQACFSRNKNNPNYGKEQTQWKPDDEKDAQTGKKCSVM